MAETSCCILYPSTEQIIIYTRSAYKSIALLSLGKYKLFDTLHLLGKVKNAQEH